MNPDAPISRRDYFAIQFATKLMHVREVAPGKLAVPRGGGKNSQPTMQIQCEMGVAVKMADDLSKILDLPPAPEPGPEQEGPKVTEPEPTPPPSN